MAQAYYHRLFPAPRFLSMASAGLDISDQSIRFVRFSRGKGGLMLSGFGEVRVPEGVIDGGRIKDEAALVALLSEMRKAHGLSFVHASILEEQAYLFKLSVPVLPAKEIRGAIALSLEDHIPLPAASAVFDYELIDENESGYEMQVSVLPTDVTEGYARALGSAGLSPLSFELESQAIARALIPKGERSVKMIIDFGERGTGLSVAQNGVVLFTSTIDFGGRMLTEMVEKQMGIPFDEAEALKRSYGLRKDDSQKELFSILLSELSILRDEINRHYIYWHSHKDDAGKDRPKIEKIVLTGGDSNLFGFRDYLSSSLRIPVELGNAWTNVNPLDRYVPEIHAEESHSFVTAIGLALKEYE